MTRVTVYDPAMCCSSGVCGPDVDPVIVQFASDLDWLSQNGVEVARINLSQEPARFAENDKVKAVLAASGVEGLPVILIDEELGSSGRFPARRDLAQMAGVAHAPGADAAGDPPASASGCCGGSAEAEKPATGGCCC